MATPGTNNSTTATGAMLPGARLSYWLVKAWRSPFHPVCVVLMPIGWLVHALTALRRVVYRHGLRRSYHAGVPTIVVGNIVAGGGGKSPLVLELVERLRERGRRPAIIARGYGGNAIAAPQAVEPDTPVAAVGDEAVMLARASQVPVVVCADRVSAAKFAVTLGADVLVSDDGLQHYRLARDVEIAVVDGAYGYGNGRCLPAGPLREGLGRLDSVDLVVSKNPHGGARGYALQAVALARLDGCEVLAPDALTKGPVAAVAGIAQPESFFVTLERLGYSISRHAFPDHHAFAAGDLRTLAGQTIITTAKDAMRMAMAPGGNAANLDVWVLRTRAQLNAAGAAAVEAVLEHTLR